jgi:hypothetical protein
MKAILAKRAHRRSIGLLVGDREVGMCVMATTPLGREVLAEASEPRAPGPLFEQLGRMLGPWLEHRPRPKLVLGVPEFRVFHSARAVTSPGRKEPEAWLQESLQSAGTRVEEMVIDVAEASVGKKSVAGLVSCRRKSLADPLEALKRLSARLVLVEPTPCALLRLATGRLKPPRGSKLSARFLLGDRQALGMLVAGGLPLHWRAFDLPPGEEPLAIHSALVALRMHARGWKLDQGVDSVLIQGRPDLASKLDPAEIGARMDAKVARSDRPGYDPGSIALGLAMGGLAEEKGFDLSRTFKPRESIREIFPWAELAMQSAMLVGIVVLMADRARSLDRSHAATRADLARYRWLGNRQEGDLDKEKKTLEQKDKTAQAFLSSRVAWSSYVRDVASHMPSNTKITSLQGAGELESLSGKGGASGLLKKTFVMRLETPIPPSGETPREVDGLLESLRDRSLLKREFPVIELKDLKATRAQSKGSEAVASYSIVCLPPASKAGPSKKE